MHNTHILQTSRCAAFVLAFVLSAAASAQGVTLDAGCNPQMSRMQQRLLQKSEEGPDSLRDFVFIRRGMLQLDVFDTGVWAQSVSAARAACMKRPAPVAAARQVDASDL